MDKLGPTLIIGAITLLVLIAMWWGWRRRTRRDAPLRAETSVPAALGDQRLSFDTFYVATTAHDRPLERLAVSGLGFRARAHASVYDAGLVLSIPGELPVFVAADRIVSADRATATIDRVVEPGGLLRLAWRLPTPTTPPPLAPIAQDAPLNKQVSDANATPNEQAPDANATPNERALDADASLNEQVSGVGGPGRSATPTPDTRGSGPHDPAPRTPAPHAPASTIVDTYLRPIAPEIAPAFLEAIAAIAPAAAPAAASAVTPPTQSKRKRGAA